MNAYITLFKSMLEISLLSSVMIAAVFAIKVTFKNKIKIKTVTLLWLLVIIRLCLPVMVQSPFNIGSLLPDTPTVKQAAEPSADVAQAPYLEGAAQPGYEPEGMTPPTDVVGTTVGSEERPEDFSFFKNIINALSSADLWGAVSVVWLAGAVIVFLASLEKSIAFALYAGRSSREIDDKKFLVNFDILKIKCSINKNVKISACKLINMPVVYGVFAPHILLPESMAGKLKKEHMDAIILHELCHIKNRDILKNYAFLLGKALHWFNPLVWLAQKSIREDTELLCDQKVLAIIGDRHKGLYSQSLLEATRFVIERKTPVLTISLCENKSNLKERIIQMLKPQKKLRSAGIISVLAAIIMIIGCFTTACRPAPDTTIEFTDSPNLPAAENSKTQPPEENTLSNEPEADFTRYEAPETFVKTYEKDSLRIIVDAQVNVPANDMQSVALSPLKLTQEFADSFINFFSGESALYKKITGDQSYDFYANRLALWQQNLYNAKNNWDEVKGHDPYGNDQSRAIIEIEGMIEAVGKQLEEAPKEVEYEAVTSQLTHPVEEGKDVPGGEPEKITDTSRLVLDAYVKAEVSNISDNMAHYYITSKSGIADTLLYENSNDASSNGMILRSAEVNELAQTIGLTLNQAGSYAQQTLESMGINYMNLAKYSYSAAIKDGELYPYYVLEYCRSANGVSIQPISEANILSEKKDSGVCSQMETVCVYVDEGGVIGFNWTNVMKQGEVLDDSLSIMDFDKIIEIADEQLLKQTYKNDGDLEIVISEISLSLMPIEAGEGDKMKTIPVWDFIGYHYDADNMEEKQKMIDLNVEFSYLTINAVDGSIINR